jgi:hypothetical protein
MRALCWAILAVVVQPMWLSAQILKYDFNEGEGTTAASSGAVSDPLTFKDKLGIPTTALWGYSGSGPSGLVGDRALNLTGADGMGTTFAGPHASLESLGPVDALERFTITGWFRPNTEDLARANLVTIRNGNMELRIVGLSGGMEPGARSRLRLLINDSVPMAEVDAVGDFEPLWSTPYVWGFFAISYDGLSESNQVVFYSGGVSTPAALSISSYPWLSPIATVRFPLGNSTICIGSDPSNSDPFQGYTDDIHVYGTALGLSEVEEVRSSGVPGPGMIDFRNFIPGVLDAPVYRADGTNRLSGMTYWAQLFAGPDETSLQPWGAALSFRAGEMAGYWDDSGDPSVFVRVVPFPPGQRLAVQVRAWERRGGCNYDFCTPPRLFGQSPLFHLILAETVTPLIGLESFSLAAAPIREISDQGDQVVLRWSAGDGTAHYEVETAAGLGEPLVWSRVAIQPTLMTIYDSQGYYHSSDWILTNQVTAPAAFYRIRLLDP